MLTTLIMIVLTAIAFACGAIVGIVTERVRWNQLLQAGILMRRSPAFGNPQLDPVLISCHPPVIDQNGNQISEMKRCRHCGGLYYAVCPCRGRSEA